VGVIKVGPARARNVLVLEPGTSAGGAYFVPLARWITAKAKGWQVWSVERRENLLEDQSVLDQAKTGHASAKKLFDYYLGWLVDKTITHHFHFIPDSSVEFAKRWGMQVAVGDRHRVIAAARSGLAGLDTAKASPWLQFGGISAPYAGLYNATGSTAALIDPNSRSLGQESGLLTALKLTPKVPVTNLGQYGFALNVGTSPASLIAAQGHLGRGIDRSGAVRGWDGRGALTPIKRFAQMFSGLGVEHADGTEWYFPARLTLDSGAVGNGSSNPAQSVLGLKTTMGGRLPHQLLIYAFGARLGGQLILDEARKLAIMSHIPLRNLTLINRQRTYAHNDPNGAYPHNVFFAHLIPFLRRIVSQGR
jgi:hypothetical protein